MRIKAAVNSVISFFIIIVISIFVVICNRCCLISNWSPTMWNG